MEILEKLRQLEMLTEIARPYAERLAVAIGNHRGTNDFAGKKPTLGNAMILDELRDDLISMVIIRSWGLVAPYKRSTDMTMDRAAKLFTDSDVRRKVTERSRVPSNAADRLDDFLTEMANLEIETLRDFRHWALAHVTSKERPPFQLGAAIMLGEQVLDTFDNLHLVVWGICPFTLSLSKNRRLQSLHFWEHFAPQYEASNRFSRLSATDTGDEIV